MVTVNKKTKGKASSSRKEMSEYRGFALAHAAQSLLGVKVCGVEYPGGKSRESLLLILEEGQRVIATRRDDIGRARVEVGTLKALNKHKASVPKLFANNHSHILIQEEIKGTRLSLAFKNADERKYKKLCGATLDSLVKIHKAASAENLESLVSTLGGERDWIASLIERPEIIGKQCGIEAPKLNREALVDLLSVRKPRFIKWDSRPGNAMVDAQGKVLWFDWEHAGKRNRLDDAAWVLGDEFLPDHPEAEKSVIKRYLPKFADVMSEQEASDYLMAYGTFHMTIRLGLILRHMKGTWWDMDYCIAGDKVGINLLCAQRLCSRAARWSKRCSLTKPLSPWFDEVHKHLDTL